MHITIKNWRAFNPRADVKKPSWFRLSHDLFEDHDFYDFSPPELLSWVYLLCLASRKNSETVRINIAHVEKIGRIKERDFVSAIDKLFALGLVTVGQIAGEDPLRFQKVEARNQVKTAVRNGSIVRPESCQECGAKSVRIDAHHENYSNPLDVKWLCPACHGRTHTYAHDTYTNATNERTDERTEGVEPIGPPSPTWLAETWNQYSGTLPKVQNPQALSSDRERHARARLKEKPEPRVWIEVITRMASNDFCLGRKNSATHKNWLADFDWLVKPGTVDRFLEGKYDQRGNNSGAKVHPWLEYQAKQKGSA